MVEVLPHLSAILNLAIAVLIVSAFVAIRRGLRSLHPKLMLSAVGLGVLFLCSYLAQVYLSGHARFPGNDWVRVVFLGILGSHTLLAIALVPLVTRTLYLGLRQRHAAHRRIARVTFPVWVYVAVTGVVIYWMNNHLRPRS